MQSIYFLKPMATTILIWVTVWGIEVICIGHTVWGTKDKVKGPEGAINKKSGPEV